jgi:hypothetical protein
VLTKPIWQAVEKGSSARRNKNSRSTRTPCTLEFELFAATPQSGLYQQPKTALARAASLLRTKKININPQFLHARIQFFTTTQSGLKMLTKPIWQAVEKGSSARHKKNSRSTRTPCTLEFEFFAATPQSGL